MPGAITVQVLQGRWGGTIVGLIGGQVLGRAIGAFLGGPAGERVMQSLGGYPLTPLERRVLAQRWSSAFGNALSATAAALLITRRQDPSPDHVIKTDAMPGTVAGDMAGRKIDWVQVVQRSGEIMLAVGAICRVLGEYLEDRQRVGRESEKAIAGRL